MEAAETTREETARDICERLDAALRDVRGIRDVLRGHEIDFRAIACEASALAWDEYGYDPRYGDDCPAECDDVDDAYNEALDIAERLHVLGLFVESIF